MILDFPFESYSDGFFAARKEEVRAGVSETASAFNLSPTKIELMNKYLKPTNFTATLE